MEVKSVLDKINYGKTYEKNGIECILDPFRKKLIHMTDEEIVRQKLALFLMNSLGVPKECIFTEEPVSTFGSNGRGRMDIIIVQYTDELMKPIAVIECKSENIEISDQAIDQVIGYSDAISAKYIFVSNGIEFWGWIYNRKEEIYDCLSNIPNYSEMINEQFNSFNLLEEKTVEYERIGLDDLNNKKILEENGILELIGLDTPNKIVPYISNLIECLFDTTHTIPKCESKSFSIVEDLGIKFLNYGDASGGSFGSGYYRSILIKNRLGNHQIINISIQATGKTSNHPKYGNSTGKSVLIISSDDFEKDYMVVQINLNKFMTSESNYFSIYHNGVVNMKNARRVDLLSCIEDINGDLLENDRILLGKIKANNILYMDSPCIIDTILNTIEYTLIRDDYKRKISNLNKR